MTGKEFGMEGHGCGSSEVLLPFVCWGGGGGRTEENHPSKNSIRVAAI